MACAIDDTLSNTFEDLEIETMGLVTRSQKGKPQLSLQANYYRINYESNGIIEYQILKLNF